MTSRLAIHGRRVQLNLPDGSGLEELEKARAEFDRLGKERRETEQRLGGLVTSRAEARTADLSAAALAVRSGKKAPTVRQVDAVDEEIAKLEEHLAVLGEAADQVGAELIDQVELLREQRVGELDKQLAQAQADWCEQIDAAGALLAKVNELASLRNWFSAFPAHPSFRVGSFGRLQLRSGGGDTPSPAQALAALRDAFAPVYSTLEQNAQTKGFIDLIEQLKASTEAESALAIPAGCTGKAPEPAVSGATAALNGIYRLTVSKEDALADDSESHSAAHLATLPWLFTMKMQDGTWSLSHTEHGELWTDAENETFALEGDRISFAWHSSQLTFRFSTDEAGNLHLEPVEPMNAGDQFVWATHDWRKIAGPRPPVSTSDLAGTYRYVITKQDAIEDGLPGEDLSQYPLLATVILDPDGTWHRGEDTGSYTVSADQVAFDWPRVGYVLTFTFIADDEGDLDMTPVLPMDAGDQFIWATTEWIKIA